MRVSSLDTFNMFVIVALIPFSFWLEQQHNKVVPAMALPTNNNTLRLNNCVLQMKSLGRWFESGRSDKFFFIFGLFFHILFWLFMSYPDLFHYFSCPPYFGCLFLAQTYVISSKLMSGRHHFWLFYFFVIIFFLFHLSAYFARFVFISIHVCQNRSV
jgi:hypothetical protein